MRTGKRILVLDDEPIVGDRMKPALEKLGFHVEAFTETSTFW
jgi:CheY-like chemotaxis protein